MRKNLRKTLFAEFATSISALEGGFYPVSKNIDVFDPYGMTFQRQKGEASQFIALVTHDEEDAFEIRLAWSTAPTYPEGRIDLSKSLDRLIDEGEGEIRLAELTGSSEQWTYLDSGLEDWHRQRSDWQRAAEKAVLAGKPMPLPPTGLIPKRAPLTEALDAIREKLTVRLVELKKVGLPLLDRV